MRIKNVLFVILSMTLFLSSNVFAAENNSIYSIENLKVIDSSDVPENVIPIELNESELEDFIKSINDTEQFINETDNVIEINDKLRATDHHTKVDTQKVGMGTVNLNTYVTYSNGQFTSASPYTTFTGFTYGFDWNQSVSDYEISRDKRSVDVYSSGELDWYILLNTGLTTVYTQQIDLDGTIVFK